jgi:hypothetical protein
MFYAIALLYIINCKMKGETIQYIYTDSKHNNPLCRVTPIENFASLPQYDKEKYKEMILDSAKNYQDNQLRRTSTYPDVD